jgi:hypothetical protein
MATLTRVTAAEVGARFAGTTVGQDISAIGVTPTTGTGDLIPINSGTGTLVIITGTGTGATVVFDSVVPSSYGVDQDLTFTIPAAAGVYVVFLDNDGASRFDQGGGSAGLAKATFSVNTGFKLYAITIP